MATATLTLGSQNRWLADGTTTDWNFNFAGGYISTDHVFAYSTSNDVVPVRHDYTITSGSFVSQYVLRITPAVPDGHTIVIYRDSRNNGLPLADFVDGGGINETDLDAIARQSIFVNQETLDSATTQFQTSQPELFDQFAQATLDQVDTLTAGLTSGLAAETAARIAYASALAAITGAGLVGANGAGTVQQYIMGRTNIAQWAGVDTSGATSSRQAFQNAVTYLTTLNGGVLTGPRGTYLFDTSSEATCLLCTVPIMFDFPPGTIFKFSYYPLSLVNFVGCNGGGMRNIEMVFTGTRPGSATGLTSNHFGFNATGLLSPPDFAAFVSLLGCSNVTLENISWRGNDTIGTNLKECGIQIAGGSATGPNFGTGGTNANPTADAVFSSGNKLIRCKSNDVAFGVSCAMQDGLFISDYYSDRYFSVAFVGPGHAIYNTGMSRGSIIRGVNDNSTQLFALTSTTFAGASTIQVRSWVNGIVDGVVSRRVEGLGGVLSATQNSIFTNWSWKANRVAQEAFLVNTAAMAVVPSDTVSVQSGNLYSNIVIEDALDAGTGRSSNCPILGSGGASAPSANIIGNVYDGIYLTHYPDSGFGKSVVTLFGQRERWRVYLNSRGSGTTKALLQMTGSAAGLLSENVVDWYLTGANVTTFNLSMTNSAGSNTVYTHATGNVSQQNSSSGLVAGDRYMCDDAMYSTRADLINNVLTHQLVHALTGNVTVPSPAPGLTYTGSVIEFHFAATGVFTITWIGTRAAWVTATAYTVGQFVTNNNITYRCLVAHTSGTFATDLANGNWVQQPWFLKASDGAAAAGKSGSTRYRFNGQDWVQQGGALTFN